jgi:hypothetical protein
LNLEPLTGFSSPESLIAPGFDVGGAAIDVGIAEGGAETVGILAALVLGYFLADIALSGEDGEALGTDVIPDATRLINSNPGTLKKSKFGWLHADLRVPLPTLEELEMGCHLIGEQDQEQVFLCTASGLENGLRSCELSDDFTKHYGVNCYICKPSSK